MPRWRLIAPLVILWLALGAAEAGASCGPAPTGPVDPARHPVFTGRLEGDAGLGTAGRLFEFDVESVERGDVSDPVLVDIDVDEVSADGTMIGSSSLSIGPPPTVGKRYRVEAYIGNPEGKRRLFVNGCGGKLRALADESPPPTASPTFATAERSAVPAVAATASAFALAGGALVAGRMTRRF